MYYYTKFVPTPDSKDMSFFHSTIYTKIHTASHAYTGKVYISCIDNIFTEKDLT